MFIIIIFFNISALDVESEKVVQEALDYAVKGNYFINEDKLNSYFYCCILEAQESSNMPEKL